MKIIGLSTHAGVRRYLQETYKISVLDEVFGVPIFHSQNRYFLGGFKIFYSILLEENPDSLRSIVALAQKNYPSFRCNFSTQNNIPRSKLVHFLLDAGAGKKGESRFDLYSKKTRNQVKKSYKNTFTLSARQGPSPEEFYRLYEKSIERLGNKPRSRTFFESLERYLGQDVVSFLLSDKGTLVGANYCIRSDNFLSLLFNVSLKEYWAHNINNRLYDEMIAWALEHHIQYIDFGPASLKDETHNHFKLGFGAEERFLYQKRFGGLWAGYMDYLKEKTFSFRLRLRKIHHFFKARFA